MSATHSYNTLISRIESGENVPVDHIIRSLSIGSISERRMANIGVANSYLKIGKINEAVWSAERAWLLGHRARDAANFLINGLVAQGRPRDALDRAREAGIVAIRTRDHDFACEMVGRYNGIAISLGLPIHDALLAGEIIDFLRPLSPPLRLTGNIVRVGYLLWGEEQENNVLPPVLIEAARQQDRTRFEPVFFSIHSESSLLARNPSFRGWREEIRGLNVEFVGNEECGTIYELVSTLAAKIRQQEIDVLIPMGQLTLHFLVSALRPAPLIMGIDVGNPHVYSSPALDHVISSQNRFTMEALCDATDVALAYTAYKGDFPAVDRASLGAAPDEIIVMTSGSAAKFRNRAFLNMLMEIVAECRNVRLVIVGPKWDGEVGNFIKATTAESDLSRITLTGYRTDFQSVIRAADIYVETFPISGGYASYEAMVAGIPLVTFEPVLSGLFNKNEHYAFTASTVSGSGIAVPGDDVTHLKGRIRELVEKPEFRRSIGALGPSLMQPLLDKKLWTQHIERTIEALLVNRS